MTFTCSESPARANPLTDEVPGHWAQDVVRELAAKGLLEGYTGAPFKGDRAASRWEVAMMVARLLARLELKQATFADRAELDSLRSLAVELSALGARVSFLDQEMDTLDRRVSEQERVSFYGFLDTRVVFQSFANDGAGDNDAGRRGSGTPSGVSYLAYGDDVGTRAAPTWRPQLHGVFPVVDYRLGRALTNGTGFTSLAILGLKTDVTPELEAGAEFAAFSSQGDAIVDAYWGVSAPYLSNPFTANVATGQSLDNTPYTRMTLDRFWIQHKPSKTRLQVGSIDRTSMSPLVYAGQVNLGVYGPKRWPGYGFDVSGSVDLAPEQQLSWELLGSRFGDGVRFEGLNYQNYVLAGNAVYHCPRGELRIDGMRMAEEAPNGGPLVVGLTSGLNVAYGASTGWSIRQWVNPPGFFAGQRGVYEQSNPLGVPNTVDGRPISGWNAALDSAAGFSPGGGDFGPQSEDIYGLTARYDFLTGDFGKLYGVAECGRSDYRASRNSSYTAYGDALRLDIGLDLAAPNLALGLEYLSVDPSYGAASWSGNVIGGRAIKPFNFTGTFHLQDNVKYPHNREGFRARGTWRSDDKAASLWASAALLSQTKTSLYDVRVTAGALGPAIPTNDVIGFAPGFVDPVFYGFAHPGIYGGRSANSFDATLAPLENPRGSERAYELGASYRWPVSGWKVSGSWGRTDLQRGTALPAALGGSQHKVDIVTDAFFLEAGCDVSKTVSVNAGVDYVRASGHYDPAGLYNQYALRTGQTGFTNLDSTQWVSHLGVDWQLSEKTSFNLTTRRYDTDDHVSPVIQPGVTELGQVGSTAHPFSWSGWQVSSEMKVAF
jgi:hypothetical protein